MSPFPLPYSPALATFADDPVGASRLQSWTHAERQVYLQSMLLPDADAFSMAHSVELRTPFVDSVYFDAATRMKARVLGRTGKRRLTQALRDPWLEHVAQRPKSGFTLPMKRWMSSGGPLASRVAAAVDPDAAVWQHLEPNARARFNDPTQKDRPYAELWAITVLNEWLMR